MTDEERKAWEELVELCRDEIIKYTPKFHHLIDDDTYAILAANAELKRLREAIDEMEKAYPSDIFTEPTPDDFAYIHKVRGLSERLHGSWARHLVEVIRRRAKEGRDEEQQ